MKTSVFKRMIKTWNEVSSNHLNVNYTENSKQMSVT